MRNVVMTEAEWRTSHEPTPLLTYLKTHVSERKSRLLACACCRQIWEYLPDKRSREGVEVCERFADDLASPKDLAKAHANAMAVREGAVFAVYWATSNRVVSGPLSEVFTIAAEAPAKHAAKKTNKAETWIQVQTDTMRQQAELVREVFGNPFRRHRLSPAVLAWEGGLAVQLAEGIYRELAFDRMPFLGDALEEAGCDDVELLDHCRRGGPHVRGCWVVDLVLGKD